MGAGKCPAWAGPVAAAQDGGAAGKPKGGAAEDPVGVFGSGPGSGAAAQLAAAGGIGDPGGGGRDGHLLPGGLVSDADAGKGIRKGHAFQRALLLLP